VVGVAEEVWGRWKRGTAGEHVSRGMNESGGEHVEHTAVGEADERQRTHGDLAAIARLPKPVESVTADSNRTPSPARSQR
jgi:hypothetical protein